MFNLIVIFSAKWDANPFQRGSMNFIICELCLNKAI